MSARVGLTMIVRDEEDVIGRCLSSVRDHIDWWVIIDTGSVDDTQTVALEALKGIPGHYLHLEWVDFADARNFALAMAGADSRGEFAPLTIGCQPSDYALWIDADDLLEFGRESWGPLTEPGYTLTVRDARTRYGRTHLTRLDADYLWQWPVHEALIGPVGVHLPGVSVVRGSGGARSKDPHKYRRDAAVLGAWLADYPDDTRAWFYYAQSLYDAHNFRAAADAYEHRSLMVHGWESERWYAGYRRAMALEWAGDDRETVTGAYLAAALDNPLRAEPLAQLERLATTAGDTPLADALRGLRATMKPPAGELFVEPSLYGARPA